MATSVASSELNIEDMSVYPAIVSFESALHAARLVQTDNPNVAIVLRRFAVLVEHLRWALKRAEPDLLQERTLSQIATNLSQHVTQMLALFAQDGNFEHLRKIELNSVTLVNLVTKIIPKLRGGWKRQSLGLLSFLLSLGCWNRNGLKSQRL